MTYLVLVLVALALLIGFVLSVRYERKQGSRFFASERGRFDAQVERAEFIIANVDLGAFARDEIRHAMTRMGHTVAHFSLQAVRATERLLTRLVRHLRAQHEEEIAPRETAREFVKTLSEFKDGLKATHPDVSVTDTVPGVE
ncbi:MAG: hypothetical protein ACHQU0_01295 [Candidatus Paceibacteria bacterium]